MASFGAFLTYLFSLPQEEEKMKQILNTLNISEFISKCTNYIYNTYIYYRTLCMVVSFNVTLYKVTSSS